MLQTELTHLLSKADHKSAIDENENVMVCCGRMGPMCIPVYSAMQKLESKYPNVKFADMEFDIPDAEVIRNHPACTGFMGLPFVAYYKNGELVHATSSIQSEEQITEILNFKLVN